MKYPLQILLVLSLAIGALCALIWLAYERTPELRNPTLGEHQMPLLEKVSGPKVETGVVMEAPVGIGGRSPFAIARLAVAIDQGAREEIIGAVVTLDEHIQKGDRLNLLPASMFHSPHTGRTLVYFATKR